MTYGRARLWLGIFGVGSIVTISSIALATGTSQTYLETSESFGVREFLQLAAVIGLFMAWLMPLDFLGGFLLPTMYQKSNEPIAKWLRGYAVAALCQALLFVLFGSLIVVLSQLCGIVGGAFAVCGIMVACFIVRNRLMMNRETSSAQASEKLLDAVSMIQSWEIFVPQTVLVEHEDTGFTGGIIGLGKRAKIVIPTAWLSFTTDQLAAAIARRALAISNGSYTRGLIFASFWNVAGFLICSLLPGAGLTSIAGLVSTLFWFTLWSFIGLLTLPTISRRASLGIDQALVKRGMPLDLITNTASKMDQLQDDEPKRPQFIETIFHPVPSVSNREAPGPIRGFAAWNVARTTLFFSWACLGFLARSVHCNVGRPELWTMLPTD